jgi:hypothetical protein
MDGSACRLRDGRTRVEQQVNTRTQELGCGLVAGSIPMRAQRQRLPDHPVTSSALSVPRTFSPCPIMVPTYSHTSRAAGPRFASAVTCTYVRRGGYAMAGHRITYSGWPRAMAYMCPSVQHRRHTNRQIEDPALVHVMGTDAAPSSMHVLEAQENQTLSRNTRAEKMRSSRLRWDISLCDPLSTKRLKIHRCSGNGSSWRLRVNTSLCNPSYRPHHSNMHSERLSNTLLNPSNLCSIHSDQAARLERN